MRIDIKHSTLAAIVTLAVTVRGLPQDLASDKLSSKTIQPNNVAGHEITARPDASLIKRAEIEAFSYAALVQGYHDVDLTEPKATKALSDFINNNQPAPLPTTNPADKDGDGLDDKTGEESLVWPDGLDAMDDNAINVWPHTLYDLVVNGVKDQEWVKYWKIDNQATPDAPAPAEQTKPTEPPPTSAQETTVDSASISSASASSASLTAESSKSLASVQAKASVDAIAAAAILAGAASGAQSTASTATSIDCPACSAMAEPYTGPYNPTTA